MIELPLLEIRTLDICAMLLAGLVLEVVSKGWSMQTKRKSTKEERTEYQLKELNFLVTKKRSLGPSAFVECSKLERQMLAKEKELAKLVELRKVQMQRVSKVVRNLGYVVYALVFAAYYSHDILSVDGTRVLALDQIVASKEEEAERATAFLQGFLFPLSYVGMGMRVARFGLPTPGMGALLVLWSAQVTTGQVMDGLEWLV